VPASPELSSPSPSRPLSPQRQYVKTLRLSSDRLKQLHLKKGANTITFSLSASGAVACTARIFLWDSSDLIVVSDIDGTITKSDALGHVFTMIGRDWTHVGVAKLYTDIARNGYNIMYLTSRAIGQADSTRDYLKGIKQNNHQLPEGPVIMSPDRLMASLHRCVFVLFYFVLAEVLLCLIFICHPVIGPKDLTYSFYSPPFPVVFSVCSRSHSHSTGRSSCGNQKCSRWHACVISRGCLACKPRGVSMLVLGIASQMRFRIGVSTCPALIYSRLIRREK
jgi:hypothetical protein